MTDKHGKWWFWGCVMALGLLFPLNWLIDCHCILASLFSHALQWNFGRYHHDRCKIPLLSSPENTLFGAPHSSSSLVVKDNTQPWPFLPWGWTFSPLTCSSSSPAVNDVPHSCFARFPINHFGIYTMLFNLRYDAPHYLHNDSLQTYSNLNK